MKKLLYLFPLLFGLTASAQDSLLFKMKYLPAHDYASTLDYNINCKVNLAGDEKILGQLKSQGITPPVNVMIKMAMIMNIKSGSPETAGDFPIIMNTKVGGISVNVNGKDIPMPVQQINSKAAVIYGHAGADGKLRADSLGGMMKDTSKEKITRMMNSFQNHIQFPDHAMHVGETFTQEIPFNLPMAGGNTSATAKVVYKLTSIANGKAYFDVTQNVNLTIPVKGQMFTLTGDGTGKMVFNIAESFPDEYQSDINLKFSGKVNTLQIDGTANMQMDYKNAISANPQ